MANVSRMLCVDPDCALTVLCAGLFRHSQRNEPVEFLLALLFVALEVGMQLWNQLVCGAEALEL